MIRIAFLVVAGALAFTTATMALEDRVLDFPADYKTAFTKYYDNDRLLADEQTISLYANDIAKSGAKSRTHNSATGFTALAMRLADRRIDAM